MGEETRSVASVSGFANFAGGVNELLSRLALPSDSSAACHSLIVSDARFRIHKRIAFVVGDTWHLESAASQKLIHK